MTKNSKTALIILALIASVSEFIAGFPFFGGWYVLALGWQPLAFNAFIYLVMVLIFIFGQQNTIRPMLLIPAFGIVANGIAIIPVIGMVLHWIMLILLIFFLMIVLVSPVYIRNAKATVIYTDEEQNKTQHNK
ncbi:hypothetical protein ACJVVW_06025 [Staphylococcus coagulans]|uniref:hypothetical protein n=1 Tax=Staphylococcus coagulans TaxID=74706 RepID=UPI00397F0A88